MVPLLLSACHTAPHRPGLNDVATASPDRHVPVMDTDAQQRHFSDLKSRYFGMGAGEKSPWNPYYIASTLSKGTEAARDASQHQEVSGGAKCFLGRELQDPPGQLETAGKE